MTISKGPPKASLRFSREVVQYLRQRMTLNKIGELIDCTESFVSLVGQGKRNLTINHLIRLEKSLHKPLPLLILEASEKSVSKDMRPQYDSLHKILEKAGKLRASIVERNKAKVN